MSAVLNAPAVALNGVNGVATPADSVDNGALSSAPDSPEVSSPTDTSAPSLPVKIDTGDHQRDSDVRHEPLKLNLDKLDDASTRPQLGTPADPASIPFDAPKGTPPPLPGHLLEDVQMAETSTPAPNGALEGGLNGLANGMNGVNGYASGADDMVVDTPTPAAVSSARQSPMESINGSSATTSYPVQMNGGSDQPPPAKRPRTHSDAEQASLVNSPPPEPPMTTGVNTAASTTPVRRSPTPTPQIERKATLSQAQFRFCISTVRTLRKQKDSVPFLLPVDPVALNIPHYPSIIKHPMDFSTIDRKLAASNPSKPDPNLSNPRYLNADEFIMDVRQIFKNSFTFNGPDHPVTLMGKRVEAVFDKQIKQLPPPAEEPKPPVVKKLPTPPPPAPSPPASVPPKKTAAARRPSTSVPIIRRSEATESARPKREIHPPPPKDLPYADPPKKTRIARKSKHAADGTEERLKYCAKILNDLFKKSFYNIAHPFYEPVDPVKLNIPNYPKIVKRPMDMTTMKRKLENKEYVAVEKFHDDFMLMIRNCMAFNPIGTPVHAAGVELQRVFLDKWQNLPPLRPPPLSEDDDEDDGMESEEDRLRSTVMTLESKLDQAKADLAAFMSLKNQPKKPRKEKKERKREKQVSPPIASSSRPNGKAKTITKKKSLKKATIPDDDALSFDQKKELSEAIGKLDGGEKLEKVISIIHEGVPEIRDSTEEIELDIDQLPAPVLTKLYNYVVRPQRLPPPKRARTGTGTGTGGLKRKSMDEDVEAEKIKQLEERMRMFDTKNAGGGVGLGISKHEDESEHSSDDSSSDSSASDSE